MKLKTIWAKYIISYLLYLPFGIIFLPFSILKCICDIVDYLDDKVINFLYDTFIDN